MPLFGNDMKWYDYIVVLPVLAVLITADKVQQGYRKIKSKCKKGK